MHRVAVDLAYVSTQAHQCDRRYPLDHTGGMTVKDRIEQRDREAIYDAIVEAVTELDGLRENIGKELSDSEHDVLARTAELREAKSAGRCTATICSSRWNKQETAETDRGGKERQRSAARTGKKPASHG